MDKTRIQMISEFEFLHFRKSLLFLKLLGCCLKDNDAVSITKVMGKRYVFEDALKDNVTISFAGKGKALCCLEKLEYNDVVLIAGAIKRHYLMFNLKNQIL